MDSLAVRNNNPLNIRLTRDKWVGLSDVQDGKGFCKFISPLYGFRAAFVILRSYHRRGINTIRQIIATWAPPSENDLTNYYKFICAYLAAPQSFVVSLENQDLMCSLVRAMARFESGQWYDIDIIKEAYSLAFVPLPFPEQNT